MAKLSERSPPLLVELAHRAAATREGSALVAIETRQLHGQSVDPVLERNRLVFGCDCVEGAQHRARAIVEVDPSLALHPYSVTRILKRAAAAAACVPAASLVQLSGHSMRVGAAQDMIASGLGVLPIMQVGGWRPINVVARYVESANLSTLFLRSRQDG